MRNFLLGLLFIITFSFTLIEYLSTPPKTIDLVTNNKTVKFEVKTINSNQFKVSGYIPFLPHQINELFNVNHAGPNKPFDYQINSLEKLKEILDQNNIPYTNIGHHRYDDYNYPPYNYGYIVLFDNISTPFDPIEYSFLIKYQEKNLYITIPDRNHVQVTLLN